LAAWFIDAPFATDSCPGGAKSRKIHEDIGHRIPNWDAVVDPFASEGLIAVNIPAVGDAIIDGKIFAQEGQVIAEQQKHQRPKTTGAAPGDDEIGD